MSVGIEFILRGNTTQFNVAMAQVQKSVSELGKGLTKSFQASDLARGLSTALGLSVASIGQKFARMFTGVSEDAEKAYREIEGLTDRITEATIRNNRARLNDEQKLTLAIQDRDRLQKQVENARATTAQEQLELAKKRLALEEKVSEVAELEGRINDKNAREQEKFYEMRDKAVEADKKAKEDAAEEERKRLKAVEADKKAKEDAAEEERKRLKELGEEDVRWYRERVKNEQELADLKFSALGDDEKLVELNRQKAALESKIRTDRLDGVDTLESEIELQKVLNQLKGIQSGIEKTITEEKKEQVKHSRELESGAIAGIRGGQQFNQATDESLREIVRRNNQQIAEIQTGGRGFGIGQDLEVARLRAENLNINNELDFRRGFLRDLSMGEDAARRNFAGDPLQFDRVLKQLTQGLDVNDKSLTELEKIRQLLSGKFVNQ